jgi:hypothetical protein
MATKRESPSLADYMVTALSPVLIMLMVGSLVFFLVEVLYAGQYSGKLLYTLFFFVVGAVLIARISIEADAARASLYGLFLGVVTYIALLSYIEYPGGGWLASFGWLVNLSLMLLIWWSAHKLTWDCTHIDEKRKGAGRGLLSAVGLDTDTTANGERVPPESPASREHPRLGKNKTHHHSRLWDWIERYQKYREERQTALHTPGVWVIYFALAALPLFALGQSLIDPEDNKRRQATFLQMTVYVGSALALLVTTSLLGLRRYLRQRKAKIPRSLTASWLGLGAAIIGVFLVLGAFLPRPHSEVPWFGIARAGKADRQASQYAINKTSSGKGEGATGDQTKSLNGKASARQEKPGGGSKAEKVSGKDQGANSGSEGKKDQVGSEKNPTGKSSNSPSETKNDRNNWDRKPSGGNEQEEETGEGTNGNNRLRVTQSNVQFSAALQKITTVLKWVVFAIVVVLVVIAVAVAILHYLAPFTKWAHRLLEALQSWWAYLWGHQRSNPGRLAGDDPEPLRPVRPPPFRAFSNPFIDGTAPTRDPVELTQYTFQALDSWAWDHGCGRDPTETQLEFAARLAALFPELSDSFLRFGQLCAGVSYSGNPPPADTLATLESLWDGLVHEVTASS